MARSTAADGLGTPVLLAVALAGGCLDPPPPLPQSSGTSSSAGTTDTLPADSSSTGTAATCGNGVIEPGEDCDGASDATCEGLGYDSGAVTCGANCLLDISECVPTGMVFVPGGEFEMSSNGFTDEELPVRIVQVDRFYIDQYEVTVAEYADCIDAGACDSPPDYPGCNWSEPGHESHPSNCVTWDQAAAYCAWVDPGTKRLPTEAEWEKAARGTDARYYPWGFTPEPTCEYVVMSEGGDGCGMDSTAEVGSLLLGESPYGAMDMLGNVSEWVSDWYEDGYDPDALDNPTGPTTGAVRSLRGGSWIDDDPIALRTSSRDAARPDSGLTSIGFRCALTPAELP